MSNAKRLAAKGVPFKLNNGQTVHARYTFAGIAEVEEQFGSLDAMTKSISVQEGEAPKAMWGPVLKAFYCALLDETVDGEPVTLDLLGRLVDPGDFPAVTDVIGEALDQAFPTKQPAEIKPAAPRNSRGRTGTTSAQSRSDGLTAISGG